MAFMYLPLIQSGRELQHNYDEIIEAIDRMHLGLDILGDVGNEFVETGFFNESLYSTGNITFRSGCRQFNYRIFMFETRVVQEPVAVITERLEEFQMLNRSLVEAHNDVEVKILQISGLLKASIGKRTLHLLYLFNYL